MKAVSLESFLEILRKSTGEARHAAAVKHAEVLRTDSAFKYTLDQIRMAQDQVDRFERALLRIRQINSEEKSKNSDSKPEGE